jgi:hypothetical protein
MSSNGKVSDTPRTDAWFKENGGECYRFSKMDAVAFARELERELADALALAEQNAQIAEAMGKRAVVSATALPVAAKELLENALGALTACDGKDDCCGEVDHGRHTWPLKFEIRDRIKDYLNGLDRTSA